MSKHRSIKRIVHRVMEEIRATKKIAEITSWQEAMVTFAAKVDIQVMNRNGYQESEGVKRRLLRKHEVMMAYFEKKYAVFCTQYDYNRELLHDDPMLRERVWICWWQGMDNAPELIKMCVQSITRNAGDHLVTIVTEKNYREYVNIPQWVEDKYRRGIISRTHFSDILRLSLLAEHGGMWLDATFFCTEPILDAYFQLPLWSIKRPDYLHGSVACGQFATYSLACSYENRWIFATIRDFVLHYWKEIDVLIDYLFLDYMFVLAQRKDLRIAEAFDSICSNNPHCDDLVKVLSEPYDEQKWKEMISETALYKLTWKRTFFEEKNGKPTFYAKLLDGTL